MEKRYRLVEVRITPSHIEDGEEIPSIASYAYVTEVIENGVVIARSDIHRGTAPADDGGKEVIIALDGTKKTVGAILTEAGT